MKSYKYYDCFELEEEIKALGWSSKKSILGILSPNSNGSLEPIFLKKDEDEDDWDDDYEDDYEEDEENEELINLIKYIRQLGIEDDEIRVHCWW